MKCSNCGYSFLDGKLKCLRCGAVYGEISVYESSKNDGQNQESQDEYVEISADDLVMGRSANPHGESLFGDLFGGMNFGGGLFGRMTGSIFGSFGSTLDSIFGGGERVYIDEDIAGYSDDDELEELYTYDAFGDLVPKKKCPTVTLSTKVECYDESGNRTDKKGIKETEKQNKKAKDKK